MNKKNRYSNHLTFFLERKEMGEFLCLTESHVEILIIHIELMVFHN